MRRVLTINWFLVHVFVLVAVLVMLRLGLWQWHRATSPSGGLQNYAYAFQWPLFAVFAIVLWVKTLREEVRRDPSQPRGGPALPAGPDTRIVKQRGFRIGIMTQQQDVDADDDEVIAYNARLAALNAHAAAVDARGQGR